MIQIIRDVEIAKSTVLRRKPLADVTLPPRVAQHVRDVFGREMNAAEVVDAIIDAVQKRGDAALFDLATRIDGVDLATLEVDQQQISDAYGRVPQDVIDALELAATRIADFHRKHVPHSWIEFSVDGALGQLIRPLERVGIYAPGGTADYPSSILMQAVPARAAGVDEVIVASPPRVNGLPSDLTLAACRIAGVDRVFAVGGAQAIAAMAFGTNTVPRVDKIFGPGNIFVALAKRRLYGTVGIDQIAGPTETLIIADDTASPASVAADMLAQAEHDALASAILLTPSARLAGAVESLITSSLARLERASIAAEALASSSAIIIVESIDQAVELANGYAPEHLCLMVADGWSLLGRIRNAGGVFLGEHSPEVVGDYVAGPSHVMPTSGTARFASPVNVLDFVKVTSLVALNAAATRRLGQATVTLATAEGLTAHAAAIRRRIDEAGQ